MPLGKIDSTQSLFAKLPLFFNEATFSDDIYNPLDHEDTEKEFLSFDSADIVITQKP